MSAVHVLRRLSVLTGTIQMRIRPGMNYNDRPILYQSKERRCHGIAPNTILFKLQTSDEGRIEGGPIIGAKPSLEHTQDNDFKKTITTTICGSTDLADHDNSRQSRTSSIRRSQPKTQTPQPVAKRSGEVRDQAAAVHQRGRYRLVGKAKHNFILPRDTRANG